MRHAITFLCLFMLISTFYAHQSVKCAFYAYQPTNKNGAFYAYQLANAFL